jgi:hypothetical protein
MFRALPFTRNRTRRPRLPRRFRARLWVEELESRTLLSAYSPVQVQTAYGFNKITFTDSHGNQVTGDGSGQTIAIVDAYWDPTITSDLAAFSTKYNLPQLNTSGNGTFTQSWVGPTKPPTSPSGDDWTLETALDVEWAHAMAPKANILLAEAQSDTTDATGKPTDLLNAVQYAAQQPGVVAVSMSWGGSEVAAETNWDSVFNVPGVTFVAASGDSGAGTLWPAVSPYVVAVGGTTLKLTSSNTISSETGWGNGSWSPYLGGSGGGFSQYEPLPSYQQNIPTGANGFQFTQFGVRLSPDVSYDASPYTGFYVLDSAQGGWFTVGGTSAGAPQWAALVAIADQGRKLAGLGPLGSTDTLNALYSIYNGGKGASYASNFHDITSGNSTGTYYVYNNNGQIIGQITVKPGTGYDLVTGLGSPAANFLAVSLANAGKPGGPPLAPKTESSSGSTSGSGSGSGSHHRAPPAATGSAVAAPADSTGSGSLSGSQSSTNSAAAASSSLLFSQTGLALANASAVHGVAAPVSPAGTAVIPASATVAAPLPPARAAGSTGTLPIDSGGGDLLDQDAQPEDVRAVPAAPVMPPAAPPAAAPQVPIPGIINPVPDAAYPRDGAFVQGEGVPVIEPEQAALALADSAPEAVDRLEPSFAMSGLAIALLWHWRGHTSASEEDERRRAEESAE